jgi:hypothetical protein
MTAPRNPAVEWLESPEGEKWSRGDHRPAHAGESHLPNHIASVRPTPGRDPVWDPAIWRSESQRQVGPRDPRQDPSGGLPLGRRRPDRTTRPARTRGSR